MEVCGMAVHVAAAVSLIFDRSTGGNRVSETTRVLGTARWHGDVAARGACAAASKAGDRGPRGSAAEGELSMTNIRLVVVFLSMLVMAGLMLATSRLATAEGIVT